MSNIKKRVILYIIIGLAAVLIIGGIIAASYNRSGELSESLPDLPDVGELLSLGQRFLLELDYEQATVMFTGVIEIEPRNVAAYIGRGTAYVMWNEQLELARADFEMAIEIDGANADGYLGLVDVYIRMSEFDKALEIARLGYEQTGSDALLAKIQELEGGGGTDSSGRVRRTSGYDANGVLLWYHIFEPGRTTSYDAAGNVKHYSESYGYQGENGSSFYRNDFFMPDGSLRHYVIHERVGGRTVQSTTYTAEGIANGHTTFTYNSLGQNERHDNFRPDGTLVTYIEHEYDEAGNKIKDSSFNADGTLRYYKVMEYDENGKISNTTTYDADGNVTERTEHE